MFDFIFSGKDGNLIPIGGTKAPPNTDFLEFGICCVIIFVLINFLSGNVNKTTCHNSIYFSLKTKPSSFRV